MQRFSDMVYEMWTQLVFDDLAHFKFYFVFCVAKLVGSLHNVLAMWTQLVVFDDQT